VTVPVGASELIAQLTELRSTRPEAIAEALSHRRRPAGNEGGTLFLVAADHPARGVLKAGDDPMAMADRGELLRRLVIALGRPGVHGILGTADVVEDLALLGALDGKMVFGSMNRGGLAGSSFELDDRFTAYTVEGIARSGLDGGKMMVRIADCPETLHTLSACAQAINDLAARNLPAMIEVFAAIRDGGKIRNRYEPDELIRAIAVVSALGTSSARLWLKVPVVNDMARVMRATTLPTLLLGGDPGPSQATFHEWEQAMAIPQVRGLVAGRTLLYPPGGDVAGAVDAAAAIVARKPKAPSLTLPPRGAGEVR
jgi:uncharacterized protein